MLIIGIALVIILHMIFTPDITVT